MRLGLGAIFLLLLPLALILGFQNCSSQVPFADPELGPVEKLINGELFPYEVTFDQIAYMSCSEQGNVFPDPRTFFTFRAGAYQDNSGLSITDQFMQETEKMKTDEKVSVLAQQLISAGTRLQFAIRSAANFQLSFINEGGAQEGVDFANLFTFMGDETFSPYLLNTPGRAPLNQWPAASFDSQYRFEGNLRFDGSEAIQNELRAFLSREGIFALTFSEEGQMNARGPGYLTGDTRDLGRNVFGTAVQMRFKQPLPTDFAPATPTVPPLFAGPNASTDMPPRLLASIDEVVIDKRYTGRIGRQWNCPATHAFRIVMPGDAVAQKCDMEPDPVNPTPTLQQIRESLYVEDWFVDIENHCVVPKPDRVGGDRMGSDVGNGACYGLNSNLQRTHKIQYDMSQPCGFGNANGLCPHFVSICFRN